MSKFDYSYDDTPEPKQAARLELWDMLSIFVLLITACIGVYFVLIYMFPASALNPLNPNPVDPNAPPTATITPLASTHLDAYITFSNRNAHSAAHLNLEAFSHAIFACSPHRNSICHSHPQASLLGHSHLY